MPFLVTLREQGGAYVGDRFLRASDVGDATEHAEAKTVVWDLASDGPVVPNGSLGFRWGKDTPGRWNLDLGDATPALSLLDHHERLVEVDLPRFDIGEGEAGGTMRRGVPARMVGGHLVTTVFDLLAAQLGVAREDLPGQWPSGLRRPRAVYARLAG